MKNFAKKLKNGTFKKNVEIKGAFDTLVQPFKEMPSVNNTCKDKATRINAHDLFSFYTADIIKDDVVFSR